MLIMFRIQTIDRNIVNENGGFMLHIPFNDRPTDTIRGKIYRQLYFSRNQYTKQSLAKDCGISMPTLYQNLSSLMEDGLVDYAGEDLSTGGRRARMLRIVPEARLAIGISVTEHHLRIVAIDLAMNEHAFKIIPFDYFDAEFNNRGADVKTQLEIFLDENNIDRERILGVGIAFPGLINDDCSYIVTAPTLGVNNQPISNLIESIPYPVYVANDASCSGFAEWFARRDNSDMAYLSLENGVGGCIMINALPFDGDNRRSAEFGHICVQPGGRRCSCGKRGCLEAYCTARRIDEEFGITNEEFFQRVNDHDPDCETLWYDMIRHLAIGINNIRMVLNCNIVLGGFLTEYLSPDLPTLKKYIQAGNPFDTETDFVQLSIVRKNIAPIGAALYFVKEFVETTGD